MPATQLNGTQYSRLRWALSRVSGRNDEPRIYASHTEPQRRESLMTNRMLNPPLAMAPASITDDAANYATKHYCQFDPSRIIADSLVKIGCCQQQCNRR